MKNVLLTSLLVVIAALIGFYGGRYYEQKRFEKMRQDRINSGQRPQVQGQYVPGSGMGPGNGYFHRE